MNFVKTKWHEENPNDWLALKIGALLKPVLFDRDACVVEFDRRLQATCRQRANKERRPLRGKGGEPSAHHSGSEVWVSALFWRRALALARWRRWVAIFGGGVSGY